MKNRKTNSLIGLLLLSVLFHSCCTYCVTADDINDIEFYGFEKEVLSTVIVETYTIGNGFQEAIDSTSIINRLSTTCCENFTIVPLRGINFNINNEYKITLSQINKTYELTEFKTTERVCDCKVKYSYLSSYKVNGKLIEVNSELRIDK